MARYFHLITVLCALLLAGVPAAAEAPVTVFAAASLKNALDEVADGFSGKVVISYGGSGTLARQVAAGAPADVVILANTAWMDWLSKRGAVAADSRRNLLGNRLVLVGPAGAHGFDVISSEALLERLAGGRLAVGNTAGVPAGIYARQWLESAGMWADIAPHLAETENVRAALALVSRGEAPLGVVYATDAAADNGVTVLHRVGPSPQAPILYPVARVTGGTGGQGDAFMLYLFSESARDVFEAYGFKNPDGEF